MDNMGNIVQFVPKSSVIEKKVEIKALDQYELYQLWFDNAVNDRSYVGERVLNSGHLKELFKLSNIENLSIKSENSIEHFALKGANQNDSFISELIYDIRKNNFHNCIAVMYHRSFFVTYKTLRETFIFNCMLTLS